MDVTDRLIETIALTSVIAVYSTAFTATMIALIVSVIRERLK